MDPKTVDSGKFLDGSVGKRTGTVEVRGGSGADGRRIPLAVVKGARPGPTVWINAAIHGDEYLGPAVVVRLFARLDPEEIHGRVILTPSLNPAALASMQRFDPADPVDLNRVWSTERRGMMSSAVLEWATAELLARSDSVLDLHSGGNRFLQQPFSVYPEAGGTVQEASAGLAKACGLPWVWAHRGPMLDGALITAAARRGKSAALVEVGGEGKAEPSWIDAMAASVWSALIQAGVLEGDPRYLEAYRVFQDLTVVRNRREGLWSRTVEPGTDVAKGEPLGHVTDLLGEPLELVTSPVTASVAGVCTYGFVPADDYLAELAHGFREEGPPS